MTQRGIPLASHWSETPIARLLGPMQAFMHRSASSGILLIGATVVALVLANSALAEGYDRLLHTEIAVTIGGWALRETLLHWVNDGLMAIFFFLVGLEIKRELLVGELASRRAATLPFVAAVGGALVPAALYLALNAGRVGAAGWGVPMATDIAFALGCLAILGSRVPLGLKIFLTAVAIVDDLIAVLVIALFYSGGVNGAALGVGFALLALLLLANVSGIRTVGFYATLGVLVWLAFLQSGVHATMAGVLVALTIPARYQIDDRTFLARARGLLDRFEASEAGPSPMITDQEQQSAILALEDACERAQAPLQKMEHRLHLPVNFVIMPVFALANAGVPLSLAGLAGEGALVTAGIFLGLVVGKPVGLLLASWLAIRAGIAVLPAGVSWAQLAGAGVLAGIGFTMSLFIASLGLPDATLLNAAKLGILAASLVAGAAGIALLSRTRASM